MHFGPLMWCHRQKGRELLSARKKKKDTLQVQYRGKGLSVNMVSEHMKMLYAKSNMIRAAKSETTTLRDSVDPQKEQNTPFFAVTSH